MAIHTTVRYGKLNPKDILNKYPKGVQEYIKEVDSTLEEIRITPINIVMESKDYDGEYSLMEIIKKGKSLRLKERVVGLDRSSKLILNKRIGSNPSFSQLQNAFNYP